MEKWKKNFSGKTQNSKKEKVSKRKSE